MSEPHNASPEPGWLSFTDGLACLVVGLGNRFVPPRLIERGRGFVAVRWGQFVAVAAYVVPDPQLTGEAASRQMYCGVPQGSVLGPLLWVVGYDSVLWTPLPPDGVHLSCYADDTLVLATGDDAYSALTYAEAGTRIVIRKIE